MSKLIILSGILLTLFLMYVFFSSKQISEIRKEKQITIIKHDTIYEPKPAYFIFDYLRSGSFDTVKNGKLITTFFMAEKSDTILISGELFAKVKQRYKEHLDSINGRR